MVTVGNYYGTFWSACRNLRNRLCIRTTDRSLKLNLIFDLWSLDSLDAVVVVNQEGQVVVAWAAKRDLKRKREEGEGGCRLRPLSQTRRVQHVRSLLPSFFPPIVRLASSPPPLRECDGPRGPREICVTESDRPRLGPRGAGRPSDGVGRAPHGQHFWRSLAEKQRGEEARWNRLLKNSLYRFFEFQIVEILFDAISNGYFHRYFYVQGFL